MANKLMPIDLFVEGLVAALDRHDGYIMGAKGQDPKKWSVNSWYYTQYKDRKSYTARQEAKALHWREHAQRVWDCNGLAEGLYEDFSGVNINARARNNYATWCNPKGTGSIPAKYRVPGAAVFVHSAKSGYITHVGYIWKPVDANNPNGDQWVIEAKGVMDGVVATRLSARSWNRWGLMTKYFDYGNIDTAKPNPPSSPTTSAPSTPPIVKLGSRLLKRGSKGEDVSALQRHLADLGYNLGTTGTKKNGVDGDYGSRTVNAVKQFQKKYGLEVDGQYGPKTHAQLVKVIGNSALTFDVRVTGGTVNVRSAPNTSVGVIKYRVKKDTILKAVDIDATSGWYKLEDGNYISNKYIVKV